MTDRMNETMTLPSTPTRQHVRRAHRHPAEVRQAEADYRARLSRRSLSRVHVGAAHLLAKCRHVLLVAESRPESQGKGREKNHPERYVLDETAQHVARVGQQLDMLPPTVESKAVDHPRRLSRPTVDRPQAGRRSELTALSVERGEHTPILRVGEARRMKRRRVVGPPVIEDVCREELGGRLRRHDSETG